MEYIKVDNTSFKKIESQETIYNMENLTTEREMILMEIERANKRLKVVDDLLAKAKELGIK